VSRTADRMTDTLADTPHERVIRAATTCFRRWGVIKTSMGDIADAAGMQRSQIYRYFESKEALIVSAIVRQARELSRRRLREFPLEGPVEPLIVATLVVGHDQLMADEFASHLMAGDGAGFTLRLLRTEPALREAQAEWWNPLIDYGRARGEIRDDLTNDEIMDWFLLMQMGMAEHPEHYPTEQRVRDHLARFVVPAVLSR